jgi:hypothetical protein
MGAQGTSSCEYYDAAQVGLEAMIVELESGTVKTHTELEALINRRGTEILRQTLQGRLESLRAKERAAFSAPAAGVQVRERSRQLESLFGEVVVRRLGRKAPGERAVFPMDRELNLPREKYSLSLRTRAADEASTSAFNRTVRQIDSTTGGHVPKRQTEQLVVRAAQDFETFYAAPPPAAANDVTASEPPSAPAKLLVISADGSGVPTRREHLRPATRKAAEAANDEEVRGDPMAPRKKRNHDRRMAIVTGCWEQDAHPRKAEEIRAALGPRERKGEGTSAPKNAPKPENKRIWASVEKTQAKGISSLFDEVDRRDPSGTRTVIALVDGSESQQADIKAEAAKRLRSLRLVLDLIHVMSYVWKAAFALRGHRARAADQWTADTLYMLLTQPPAEVIASIVRSRGQCAPHMTPADLVKVDKCIEYLRKNIEHIEYRAYLATGLPIATGVIEGACRHLIKDRLNITGARWGVPGAEAILKLRALRSSGDWDEYVAFHHRREHERNYPTSAAA